MENMSMTVIPITGCHWVFSITDVCWAKTLPLSRPPKKSQRELENLQRIVIDDQKCRSTREYFMTISLRKVKMENRAYEMVLYVIILLSLLLFRMYFWSETPDYLQFLYLTFRSCYCFCLQVLPVAGLSVTFTWADTHACAHTHMHTED